MYFLKLKPAIATVLLLFSTLSLAEKKTEQPKQALTALQQRLQALKQELDKTQDEHKEAADALKASERAISEANKKLFQINQQQSANKTSLSKLEAETKTAQTTLIEQQQLLSEQLYQQYIRGQQSYLQTILQSERPSQIARDLYYFSYVAKARATLIRDMQRNLNTLNQLNAETASTLEAIKLLKQKQTEEKQHLEQQKRDKVKIVKSLSKEIATQRGEIKKLSRDEKRLSQLVKKLAKIKSTTPRKKNITQKDSAQKHSNEIVASNTLLPTGDLSALSFSKLKGKLRLPVRGDVSNRFGAPRQDSGISWKGLFIKANEGAEVKSVATGLVVFADWLRGFGNLIIVDHGGGYMSLYGNNQSIYKQEGDTVNAGDTIASVGNTGGNETNGLYYELRKESRPFDPLSWSSLN
ncbi:MAG: peptidoglycan DD-metalloendopeptidase family protein [Methylotenera sp.]|nr:peptidoglycan DD-metalloendopeptidase family protein [Methylotenera sp.]